jgi:hypothetical protein
MAGACAPYRHVSFRLRRYEVWTCGGDGAETSGASSAPRGRQAHPLMVVVPVPGIGRQPGPVGRHRPRCARPLRRLRRPAALAVSGGLLRRTVRVVDLEAVGADREPIVFRMALSLGLTLGQMPTGIRILSWIGIVACAGAAFLMLAVDVAMYLGALAAREDQRRPLSLAHGGVERRPPAPTGCAPLERMEARGPVDEPLLQRGRVAQPVSRPGVKERRVGLESTP